MLDVIPEKKLVKMLLDMLHLTPLLYIRGKRIMLVDVLKEQSPSSLSSWLFLREAIRDRNLMINNYLKRLNDIHSRYVLKSISIHFCVSTHEKIIIC